MSVQETEAVSVQVTRRSFTVAEYERMGQFGILSEGERVELVYGEIIQMSPIGKRHAAVVGRLTQIIALLIQRTAILWVQNPIRLSNRSEPQPDLMVLKPRPDFYETSRPTPEDVLLVIEASDTTLDYDRKVKVPIYARAGIPETWVVNLPEERIETYADLAGGKYRTITSYARGEELQSHSLAAPRVSVAEVLG